MIDISLPGLIGAMAGTVIAAANYHLFIGVLERKLREREQTMAPEERDTRDLKLSTVRRIVLTADLFLFAGVGYWLGMSVGG